MNYPEGDFLIKIKNACLAKKKTLEAKGSKLIYELAKSLERKGFLSGWGKKDGKLLIQIGYKKKEPVLLNIRLVSKPGLRVYKNVRELGKIKGPSFFIISTPQGIMTSKDAIRKRLGGEVIAEIL